MRPAKEIAEEIVRKSWQDGHANYDQMYWINGRLINRIAAAIEAERAQTWPSEEINAAAAHAARDFEGCQGEQSYPARYGFFQGVRWLKARMRRGT